MPALTGTPSEATLADVGVDEKRKNQEKNRQRNQEYRDDGAYEAVRDKLSGNANDSPPVQNDVEHKQSKEDKCDDKMNGSPVVAIEAPEE